MQRVGITGGAGTGKSLAGSYLEALRVPVLDTDQVAREVVQPGSVGLKEVCRAFGEGILQPGGELDRAALARLIFTDSLQKAKLEEILHPLIRSVWENWLVANERKGEPRAAVLIPLLFETGAQSRFDHVITLACGLQTQRKRLGDRGWDSDRVDRCLEAQWSMSRKMTEADEVWWNDGPIQVLQLQVENFARSAPR